MTEHKVGTQQEFDAGLLDRTPMGRNEGGDQPFWLRRHDEYETTG